MDLSASLSLEGRVAIVTGGASGMGKAIARRFDQAGAKVVVVDRNPQTPSIVAAAVPGAAAVVADVSEPHAHADVVAAAAEPFGLPSILVNDAGIYPHAALPQMTAEFFDETYSTNLRGVALMSVAFSNALRAESHPGAIVNIASAEALMPSSMSGMATYAATKAGVMALTRHMAVELGPHDIAVNAVNPGTVLTEGVAKGLGGPEASMDLARQALAPLVRSIPAGRLAEPDDIARVVLFLVSPMASYIRGQTIAVDGGWSLGRGVVSI